MEKSPKFSKVPAAKTGNRKVKTGCQTCKKRRVKCDEKKPACQRCTSTGRVCDGYGIWGGGNAYGSSNKTPSLPHSIASMSQKHRIAGQPASVGFEYFRRYTSTKLPGLFESGFWDSLVLQASDQEPAVLHAVAALGAAHKNDEHISLVEYNKAIQHLRQSLNSSDRDTIRVCLITCLLFVCIELLRGGFKAGYTHLSTGLRMLHEIQRRDGITANNEVILRSRAQSVEETLIEVFSRLNLQTALFGHVSAYLLYVGDTDQAPRVYDIPPIFSSLTEAKKHIDSLVNASYLLAQQATQLFHEQHLFPFPETLYQNQNNLQTALTKFLVTLNSSRKDLTNYPNWRSAFGMPMLTLYHTMAKIMTATALRGVDEMIFDNHLQDFELLLKQASGLCDQMLDEMAQAFHRKVAIMPGHNTFTIDMGFIPPLYYTLAKCRQPNLRRMVLELLQRVPHREGAWDGPTVIRMGKILLKLEEGRFYDGFDIIPSCSLSDSSIADVLPVLPISQRFNNINVALPDTVDGKATLFCRRYEGYGLWESKVAEFDVTL
ncbi:hypothetical protein TRIATDRAFT_222577 [Trichoderma atroviride IMI 206040]|uniref:Zn(2)-C6 fungal-type domain-containing protein n=1 Tax=Hypocrea atroviridis (strain ATCC 20476 / IMI 206040) TaxID=452589 RepID=G9NZE0_HYPAI|nr:uncharacterized protein TRIATDRAFT_222577 [Trichoderma atroviride IMI 206040]EHK43848.1 hypothetical protein TRIATDRAFT_222577 [Trichoderma atroviride IMI 206040]